MALRTASLALLIAPFGTPASAETFWPDHASFALKPRISLSVRPASPASMQRPARIYAMELAPSPASPADLRLSVQRRRQRFQSTRMARLTLLPGADVRPRTSVMLADMQVDLPTDGLPFGDGLTATIGWHAVKINNKSVNATSPFTRDDLRVRDAFLPSASVRVEPDEALILTADYRETVQAYGDSGSIGSLGLDMPAFRAFRTALRPQQDRRMALGARWAATPALRLGLDVFAGQAADRLAFGAGGYLPRNMGDADVQGFGVEAAHGLTPNLRWSLRYDRARLTMADARRAEERLAVQGHWRHGPWRSALTLARTSMPAWERAGHRLRVECGVDYIPSAMPAVQLGLHLTDPDRLTGAHFARIRSGPVRAMDQSRALMFAAAMHW